jgi:class 3 adenylate cyclase
MTIADEIKANAKETFRIRWEVRNGATVPAPRDVKLGNDAVYFDRATVLYADLDQSTALVEKKAWYFAAEVYKTFLYAASRLINAQQGSIVSYDGDRVMGIFLGKSQCDEAVSCALKLNYAVRSLVQTALNENYTTDYKIHQIVGIDTSPIHAVRTGVRGDNDLVWVGNSANIAAKMTAFPAGNGTTWITKAVYQSLSNPQKLGSSQEDIWKQWRWADHNNDELWSSTYWNVLS